MMNVSGQLEARKKVRVLLVEDYKLVRIGIRMVLNGDPDLEVTAEADCGEQAIHLCHQMNPDVVILDLGLPDMDGLEVTRRIRQFNPHVRILILTSAEEEEDIVSCLVAGANAYCLKDILSERLIEVVKAVYEGAVWLDPRVASRALQAFAEKAAARNMRTHMPLTNREREVLRLVVEGMSNLQIAKALNISKHTSKAHICSILQKLSVSDRRQAAQKAVEECLV
ncbi:MAG TPA: response regulator transcription factor [Oculatellaceae cyanobacterium]|jgi:DNA-binding NarL/FixJ family response regulator